MKILFAILSFCLIALSTNAQLDSIIIKEISNSFKNDYKQTNPYLHYSYDDLTQTHNYSNNWDFDGDGRKDSLYFIGNNAAHLYFYLSIILSSDGLKRDFPFLLLDLPYLETIKEPNSKSSAPPIFPQFSVLDVDSDSIYEIYLCIDNNYSVIPKKWKDHRVNSRFLFLKYEKKEIIIKNFYDIHNSLNKNEN